ncbi:anaerobic sulfatase maturase [Reinekea marinisedimentorum]|uniref:Radical SAM core domain-containing protein n=1 Tax=Reinekea marinisedimentorum TaxID=230495 RepID=A0A4R3IDX0_9GAMM|nr:anaerobic sulfatase maturase [Reinekea marinisedimentorum]TCS43778.1 uncharacterized protein BCF53_101121 [Reinekea marinisedimentorum]
MAKPFHLMAKPTSFSCNIDCDYCFYLEKERQLPRAKNAKPSDAMSDEVLRAYIKNYINSQPTSQVEFAWQGGEPTLAGLGFFRKAVALQQRFANGKTIRNNLQTNGIVLNEEWCQFLKEHNFLVGLSVDGPEELHNAYRLTATGKPTFKKVMRAVELLKQYDVPFNTLTVINNINVKHPKAVYRFLKEIGSHYQQYIPVVESRALQGAESLNDLIASTHSAECLPFSVDANEFGDFMNSIFDEWVRNDVSEVFIQLFESTLAAWSGRQSSQCIFQKTCGDAMVIEQNGDIYSCDHYVYRDHKIGNILQGKLNKTHGSKQQNKFGNDKANISRTCQECSYLFACYGDCPKHRFLTDEKGVPHSILCAGYKKIFSHIDNHMKFMANELAQGRPASNVMSVANMV